MTRYIVKPNNAESRMDWLMVETEGIDYISTSANVYRSHSYTPGGETVRDDFETEHLVSMYKKWDGCGEIRIDDHFCGTTNEAIDGLSLAVKAAAYLCDQEMAKEKMGWQAKTWEEALSQLNCGDGANENPGIMVAEWPYTKEEETERKRLAEEAWAKRKAEDPSFGTFTFYHNSNLEIPNIHNEAKIEPVYNSGGVWGFVNDAGDAVDINPKNYVIDVVLSDEQKAEILRNKKKPKKRKNRKKNK